MKPQLKYTKAFQMSDGKSTSLTLGKAYDIATSFTSESEPDAVTFLIINDDGHHHYFEQDDHITKDSFELLGDYTTVWEDI